MEILARARIITTRTEFAPMQDRQKTDGNASPHLVIGTKKRVQDWMAFAISRVFKRAYEEGMRPDENCK